MTTLNIRMNILKILSKGDSYVYSWRYDIQWYSTYSVTSNEIRKNKDT